MIGKKQFILDLLRESGVTSISREALNNKPPPEKPELSPEDIVRYLIRQRTQKAWKELRFHANPQKLPRV